MDAVYTRVIPFGKSLHRVFCSFFKIFCRKTQIFLCPSPKAPTCLAFGGFRPPTNPKKAAPDPFAGNKQGRFAYRSVLTSWSSARIVPRVRQNRQRTTQTGAFYGQCCSFRGTRRRAFLRNLH